MPGKRQRDKGKRKERKNRKEEKTEETVTASVPKIKPLKSDVVVNEGGKLTLKCETISGYPQPTIKWYKDGKELNRKSKEIKIKKKKRKESQLLIRKVKPSHAGEYTCEAVNQQGEDRSVSNIAVTPAQDGSMKSKPYDSEKPVGVNIVELAVEKQRHAAREKKLEMYHKISDGPEPKTDERIAQ